MIKKIPHILFLLLVSGILFLGYFYFFQISPVFVQKPVLEKPAILDEKAITAEQIIFILNELEAYKLHKDPLTGEKPIIKIKVDGSYFFFSVQNNRIEETETAEPDIILSCTTQTINHILAAEDPSDELISLLSSSAINIEINKNEKTLALKGYKAIYDKIYPRANEITGEVILRLNPLSFLRGINLSFLVFISLIIGLIIEKEI